MAAACLTGRAPRPPASLEDPIMCGILGYFDLRGDGPGNPAFLERMASTLRHRGPDSGGVFHDGGAALGFRRLSIIDLATGDQPIANEDETLILVCNGEIFNYKPLRAELETRGHRFRTRSDVEVLLHLYEDDGPAMLNRLNGQFAFALLDRRRKRLFLARDHAGIAPLHYTVSNGVFVFGSEIKAILEYPGIERAVDLTGLDQVFTFPGLVSPRTMFRGIHRVRPGHYLMVDRDGVREHEYWDLDYPLAGDVGSEPEQAHVDRLTEVFSRSVRLRLQADVPVGFYLSGGLDSSLTAAFIHQLEPDLSRHAFSIAFSDQRADEEKYQQLVARRVNCELHTARFDWSRTAGMMHAMIHHAECPVKETYNTCSMELSRAARAHGIKVILTGEGADELFAGYVGYRFDQARAARPGGALSPDDLLEDGMREALWGDGRVHYESDYHEDQQRRRLLYSAELQGAFAGFDCLRQPLVRKDRIVGRHPIHQRSYLDFKLRMADHLLMDHGDAMVLANSVEARYPFLDIDLIEYARRIPPDLKLRGYREKYILRRMGEGLLPEQITRREKFGWYAPGSPEMLQQGVEWIRDMLSPETIRRQGYFDPAFVAALTRQYAQPGFKLKQPFESDWLMVIATFGLFQEVFSMPARS
jgi:asparagine synthase (glutamine-hydrolysing)